MRGRADPAAGRVELERVGQELSLLWDETSEFVFYAVPNGLLRLQLRGDSGTPAVQTDWVRV